MRNKARPLTLQEVEERIKSGELTKEQAIALRQKDMDGLEYTEAAQWLTDCGGIQPVLFSGDKEE